MTIDKTSQLEVGHEIRKVSLNCDEPIVLWARPFLFSYSELHSASYHTLYQIPIPNILPIFLLLLASPSLNLCSSNPIISSNLSIIESL
jgi:hypothetical protein